MTPFSAAAPRPRRPHLVCAVAAILGSAPALAETLDRADVGPEAGRWVADELVWENRGGSEAPTLWQLTTGLGLEAKTEAEALAALCAKAAAIDGLDCKATPPALSAAGATFVVEGKKLDWAIIFRMSSGNYSSHHGLEKFSTGREEYVAVPAAAGSRYRVVLQHAENYVRVECDEDDDPDCRPATGSDGFHSKTWVLDTQTGRVVLSMEENLPEECPSWGTVIVRGDAFGFPACGDALKPTETRSGTDAAGEKDAPIWYAAEFVEGCQDGGVGAARALAATLGPDDKKRVAAGIQKGRALTKKKKYPDAIAAFGESIRLDPSAAEAYSGRGYVHLLMGALGESTADLENALALTEGDGAAAVAFRKRVQHNLDEVEKRRDAAD